MSSPTATPSQRPATIAVSHHAAAAIPYVRALRSAGHEIVMSAGADVLLIDLDVPANRPLIDLHLQHGSKAFTYPHGANAAWLYDGVETPYERMSGTFVIGEGQAELLRRFGYTQPIHVVGWPYCEILPFRRCDAPRRVLFAPEHPLANGYLPEDDRERNRAVFQALAEVPGIELVVRHLHDLELNGLPRVPGVEYVQGQPDGSYDDIDRADVVVATGTYAHLAVARGAPTIMFGQDVIPHNEHREQRDHPQTWESWRHLYRLPYDMADGPAADLIVAAARDAEGVAEWKRRWIGEQLVPERFSETLQWALALARRPSTRSFTVLADAQEVVARPQLLEAWAAQFGPDDDATLVLMAPGETLGATADALHGVFRQLGLAESDLPDLLLVPEPLGRDAERALAHGARAVLTEGPVPAAFAGLERHDAAGVADLRAAA